MLIHGFLDDASVWDGVVDSLAGEVGAVRYDLPGFGTRSGSVAEACSTTLESLAAEAGDVLEGIDGPVIVVGQSLGTQVAELVAAQHSDQVRGLVLLTPVPLGGTQLPDEVVAPFAALGGDRVAQRRLRAELSPHLSEEQLDRLTDIGVPVAADVTAHYVDVWNSGVRDAPDNEHLRRPGTHHPRRRRRFRHAATHRCHQRALRRTRRERHRQGRSLGTRRVPRVGGVDDP